MSLTVQTSRSGFSSTDPSSGSDSSAPSSPTTSPSSPTTEIRAGILALQNVRTNRHAQEAMTNIKERQCRNTSPVSFYYAVIHDKELYVHVFSAKK